MKKAER